MIKRLLMVLGLGASAIPALGQNLLSNPSFSLPPVEEDCEFDKGAPSDWQPIVGLGRNGDIFWPECPHGDPPDFLRASVSFGGSGTMGGYQVVTLPEPADGTQVYKFSGEYSMGTTSTEQPASALFEIHRGSNPSLFLLNVTEIKKANGQTPWAPFSVTAIPPAGTTQLTVVFKMTAPGGINGFHVDNVRLELETACPDQPAFSPSTPVTPNMAVRGSTVNVTLQGVNFSDANGPPTVALTGPMTIPATGVVVNSPTEVQATFTIPADAPHNNYDVVYQQNSCTEIQAPGAMLVYLPAFSNGSFEDPETASCGTPGDVVPTDWRTGESNEWGWEGRLKLNGFVPNGSLAFTPSCPTIDGNQYGTMASNSGTGGANAVAYQTFAVTPGKTYTWSGFFAGSGDNTVALRLRENGPGGDQLVSKDIHAGGGNYDWSFNFVTGTATTSVMTAEWAIARNSGTQNATHADAMAFEECSTPITYLASITPSLDTNDSVLHVTDLAGSGFTGTPTVFLSKPGFSLLATNVVVVSSTKLTCDFDLTGVPGGRYDVFVKQGGCIETLPQAVTVVAAEFINGDFELPEAPQNCGPPYPQPVGGLPTGWSADIGLSRDGNAPVPPSCPSPAGGHYGSMSNADVGTMRAWQTVRVIPGQPYRFSGQFAGSADCVISLLNGDENGTVLQSTTVYTGGSGSWVPGSVVATATSDIMTVMWEIRNATPSSPGGHADGLSFGTDCPLNWADADEDGDVDMDDFAAWQRCVSITGSIPEDLPYCRCMDRAAPYGRIDLQDFPAFSQCVSGPGIPWTGCAP